MEKEFKNMLDNKVFIECNTPPKKATIIKPLLVFTYKYDSNGDIIKRKARLAARGCTQEAGVDFSDTFTFTPTLHQDVL